VQIAWQLNQNPSAEFESSNMIRHKLTFLVLIVSVFSFSGCQTHSQRGSHSYNDMIGVAFQQMPGSKNEQKVKRGIVIGSNESQSGKSHELTRAKKPEAANSEVNPDVRLTSASEVESANEVESLLETESAPDEQSAYKEESAPETNTMIFELPDSANQPEPAIQQDPVSSETFAVDLPTALQLAGADNWNVKIARERVREAAARLQQSQAIWLPNITAGVGFNHHEGQIQATPGEVLEVSRNSLFIGGGSTLNGSPPVTGGSGGPARLGINWSLAEALFEPLAQRRFMEAEQMRQVTVYNDTLLAAGIAYFNLVRAYALQSVADKNLTDAMQVARVINGFVDAGKGSQADVYRIDVIVNQRRQELIAAQVQVKTASARLAQVLQLDPTKMGSGSMLVPNETVPLELVLVDPSSPLNELIAQAKSTRPEISELLLQSDARRTQYCGERWRPWLPTVMAGVSAGGFGGGPGSNIPKIDSRSDVDLGIGWELQNMGAGNRALQKLRRSQMRQATMAVQQTEDAIVVQVTTAYEQMIGSNQVLQIGRKNISFAEKALEKTRLQIENLDGSPLDAIQAISALADSRREYLDAIIGFNTSQLSLVRAIGRPLDQ
jgi:outer membrane protein TolC